jgi:hypothetical protein
VSLPTDVIEALERWRQEGPHYIADPKTSYTATRQLTRACLAGNRLRDLLLRETKAAARLRIENELLRTGLPEILRGPYLSPERR